MRKLFFECTYCGARFEVAWSLKHCLTCGDLHLRRLRTAEKYDVFGYGDSADDDDDFYQEPLD